MKSINMVHYLRIKIQSKFRENETVIFQNSTESELLFEVNKNQC